MAVTGLRISKSIEAFINFYDKAISTYRYCFDMVGQCDKLKCDLEHKLELGSFSDRNEKRRLLTQLEYCLKDRRYYKDRVEELEPFVGLFLSKDKDRESTVRNCNAAINHIKNSLGGTRRAENYHADRTYKPRILKDTFGSE